MLKKNRVAKTILLRLDAATDRQITNIANLKNISVSDAIREAIHAYSGYDTNRRIADRLDDIDRRLLAASTTEQMEKLSQQLVERSEASEANNTNISRIADILKTLLERS